MTEQHKIIYKWGNLTSDNFTPRLEKDLIGRAGQKPGLSTSEIAPSNRKSQGIALDQILPPLMAFPDDPNEGGTPGHVAISPVNEAGEIDIEKLKEWASSRNSDHIHPFTQILLDAVIESNVKGPPQ